jgi:hypothetical protein
MKFPLIPLLVTVSHSFTSIGAGTPTPKGQREIPPNSPKLSYPGSVSADAILRDIEIWLPYAESVDFLGLTVNKTARILPMTRFSRMAFIPTMRAFAS